jgi:hypothetical protein
LKVEEQSKRKTFFPERGIGRNLHCKILFYPIAFFGIFYLMKKSFIMHLDSLVILDKMSDDVAGKFIKIIYRYQKDGTLPSMDFGMDMAITPFINQFCRDDEKYNEFIDKQKDNGSKGGRPKNPSEPKVTQKTQAFSEKPTETQKTLNVSDSVSDNDNVSVINNKSIEERLTAFRTSLIPYVEEFGRELVRDFYDYWREVNGSGKKMRFEMEKVFNIDMRIKRWERNNKKFAKPSKKDESNMIKLPDGTMIDKKEYSKMFG